jgi:pimeloyl-ACP methyl ester carboxylesterase
VASGDPYPLVGRHRSRSAVRDNPGPVPVTLTTPGLRLVEHELFVPLDHARPDGEHITVFAREVADPDGLDRPLLLFLQGGPGHEAARPGRHPSSPGWLDRALRDFRVLMLDQRGTGRSTPVGALPGLTPARQAAYLEHMRADSIVRDAECLRRALGAERWSVLGQSFGGMCVVAYLSIAPEGLREAFVTGGLPPLGARIDDVYRATYERTITASRRYYARYPQDRARVRALLARLQDEDVRLPGGDRLTAPRLRQLGAMLGMGARFDALHHILELAPDSPAFRHDVETQTSFARNPLYAILHEACWADGGATRWAAQRMLPAADYEREPELFTGEHVYPWMFERCGALAPLREAAQLLAEHEWPRLYDPARLAANEVPVAAAIYAEDMYVERAFSEETAAAIGGLRPWLTNELQHDGLRIDGDRVLGRLIDMARGHV